MQEEGYFFTVRLERVGFISVRLIPLWHEVKKMYPPETYIDT